MRLNKWLAAHTHYSRRKADELIAAGRVTVNGKTAELGTPAEETDVVTIDQKRVQASFNTAKTTIMLNKPIGYVCSRKGQGAPTVYSLIPVQYHHLDLVGRLDKDSSGLVLLTNDGQLHQKLTHPSFEKDKTYQLVVSAPLSIEADITIRQGIALEDGISKLAIKPLNPERTQWEVRMHEGRNRQIRRTFAAVNSTVVSLTRLEFDKYELGSLESSKYLLIS